MKKWSVVVEVSLNPHVIKQPAGGGAATARPCELRSRKKLTQSHQGEQNSKFCIIHDP